MKMIGIITLALFAAVGLIHLIKKAFNASTFDYNHSDRGCICADEEDF